MGYYTNFTIQFDDPNISDAFEHAFDTVTDYEGCLDDFGMYAKWYDYEKDMIEISKQFPGVLFTVSGEGEENDDIWRSYFKDGKTQFSKAIITFEPYDEGKLK